ncbi:MAG: hypothetical protein WB607_02320 [Candidatus Acidiferrum sp.]
MEREYDLFQFCPDGSPLWCQSISGYENAIRKLQELASETENEVRAMHLPSQSVVAAIPAKSRASQII